MSADISPLRLARRERFRAVDLYPVTSTSLSAGRSTLDVVHALLAGGATCIQLREKEMSARDLVALGHQVRAATTAAGALLIVNDRVDVALAVEADGVHLGQDDLPLAEARRLAPDLLLGRSTHSLVQALQAEAEGADMINIGPLFATQSKATPHAPLGLDVLTQVAQRVHIPFSCMGGIKREHLAALVRAGAQRIALITALTYAPDVAQATRELRQVVVEAAHEGKHT